MELLHIAWMTKPVWMWLLFLGIVAALLALDLGILHRRSREISIRESLLLSAAYIFMGIAFGAWIWHQVDATAAMNYITGFVVEKSLAIDNVFVIAMIFGYFGIPQQCQHRVLFWGVLGVIIMRAIMIGLGATLMDKFSWILYIFAAFLIFTGIRMWMTVDRKIDLGSSPILVWLRSHFRTTDCLHGERFWIRQTDPKTGKAALFMTPLLLALIMIELVDIVFAVDSVPAIFAITTDPFIVYTSNIFAILGLRALYFALAAMLHRFHYLKYALAALLVFIGSKIFIADAMGLAKIPPIVSLSITIIILALGVGYSLLKTQRGNDAFVRS